MKNPYDGRFQDLAEDYPRLLLRLVRAIAPGTEPTIERIQRELRFEPVIIDQGFLLRDGEQEHVAHIEAFSRWKSDRAAALSLYNLLLKRRYKTRVDSVILLMFEKYAPRQLPDSLIWTDADGQRIETPYRTVRLWEDVDASIAFEPDGAALLDWVPWMKSGLERMEEAVERIEAYRAEPERAPYPPRVMASNLALAAASRYHKDEIVHILERLRSKSMLLTIDIFKDTWVYQDGVTEGEKKGEQKGRAEGRARGEIEAAQRMTRNLLARRFPTVHSGSIESVTDPAILDRLFNDLVDAATPEQASAALLRATTTTAA